MRYKDLIEAPIDQYAAVGNWDDPKGSFRSSNPADIERSHKIIHSPVAVQKIRQAWERVPQKFNFWMVNRPEQGLITDVYTIADFKNDKRFEPYAEEINPTADAINVIYTTNFTTVNNYKPMTAWIMAHRFVHILQLNVASKKDLFPIYKSIESDLASLLVDTFAAYGIKNLSGSTMLGLSIEPRYMSSLIPKIFTMRSARMGKLSNPLDFPAEMLAQHLLSGRIRFNPLPQSFAYQLPRTDMMHNAKLDAAKADELNARWQDLAATADERFGTLLNGLVGKVAIL